MGGKLWQVQIFVQISAAAQYVSIFLLTNAIYGLCIHHIYTRTHLYSHTLYVMLL